MIQSWEAAAGILVIVAGVLLGSTAIGVAILVWARKQVFGLGGSALCVIGVVLLGLSIWHSVEFGVNASGLSFKAAKRAIATAADAHDQAKEAAKKLGEAEKTVRPVDPEKAAELAKAKEAADKAARDAQNALQKSIQRLEPIHGRRVCIPWC